MDVSGLLLKPGDLCVAFGRVVRVRGQTMFEPPLARALPSYSPGQEPAPRPSGLGVAVRGVDEARLLDRREKDGAVEGWVTLSGVWRDDELEVLDQRLEGTALMDMGRRWVSPPCVKPLQGWPSGTDLQVPAVYEALRSSGTAVNATLFRPSAQAAVLVVAAADEAKVAAELVPLLGDRVCIVPSRYSREQVDTTLGEIAANFTIWQAYGSGETSDDEGQVVVTLDIVRVLPNLVDRARHWPPRLVEVSAWLAPES